MSDEKEISAEEIVEESPSMSPMAMSVPLLPIETPVEAEPDEEVAQMLLDQRKRHLRKIVTVALGVSAAIIVVATIRTGVEAATSPSRAAAAEAPRATQPATPPPVMTAAAAIAPVVAPAAVHPPTPTVGTITAPRGQLFTVDGTRAAGASVVVSCGSHVIRVGKDAPQTLDVPCGKTLALAKSKK